MPIAFNKSRTYLVTRKSIAAASVIFLLILISLSLQFGRGISARTLLGSPSFFRVGEKLTYNISFGKIPNAGYAETSVVSRGKISGKDAVELRAKVKTVDIVSAAFFLFDESRMVFAAPDTGLPHYVSMSSNDSVSPKETIRNYIAQPTSNFDILTLLFKAREAGGIGSFPLFEGETMHIVTFQGLIPEKIKTEAGEFETMGATVQSNFLTENGIKDLRINFSTDEFRVPVLVRLKTVKGDFRVSLTAITLPEPETPTPAPTPTPNGSPKPTVVTVKPTPTPVQYVDNEPLIPELGFQLGELLEFRVTSGGKPVGNLTLNARERKLFEKNDSLLLTATITGVEPGTEILRLGDAASAQVDPETLAPTHFESKTMSPFVGLNQVVMFNQRTGAITFGPKQVIDAPIGTHSVVSLIYAMRSFNLKPSKDASNPVNDTRVAVFWDSKSYVFTLRPSLAEELAINGEKISAQMVTINTNNKELDALNLKVWLRAEDRVPVKFSAGGFQAELISATSNLY